jgi:DNA-binding SARP family transcriptional activator
LTGLLAGVLLARPESLRLSDRWLGRLPPPETAFAHALRPAWRALAVQDLERLCLEDLKRALQRDIAAAYVEVLKRTVDTGESNALVFAGDAGNPMVRLPSDDLKWPIAESTAGKRGIQTQALPGPASLILPILMDGDVIGILTMGEPERGGVYGRSEIMRAEMLADLLSAASSAGVPLVEDAGTRSARRHPAKATPVPPAIRAFGRLEVIPARSPLAGTPTIPLRARQLLAFLLTAHPEAVPGETLMERLWPEAPPNMAGNCLYVAVHALRRALEPGLASGMLSRYVLHEAGGYRLQLDTSIWVDTREFEDSYRRGQRLARANHAEAAAREFQKALAHYRGAFLAEVALNQSPEIEAVRQRLRRQCGDMARFVVQQLVEQGGSEEAEELLLSLRRADPRDETFIDLLARIGRRVAPSTPAPGPGDHTGGTAAGPKAASSPPSGMKPGYADP